MRIIRRGQVLFEYPPGKKPKNLPIPTSLGKSLLQKSIRRNEPMIAIKTAKQLLEIDESQFLRRWLVIQAEDALVNKKYTEAAKLLRKKLPLTEKEKDFLITLVGEVAASKYRDDWVDEDAGVYENPDEVEANKRKWDNEARLAELGKPEKGIVEALRYRSTIGGMRGDIIMLRNYHNLWLDRFLNKGWTVKKLDKYFPKLDYKFADVPKLNEKDIIPESIDQHCSPLIKILIKKEWVLQKINSEYPLLQNREEIENALQGIFWRAQSSVNFKRAIGDGRPREWYSKGQGKNWNRQKDEAILNSLADQIKSIRSWWLDEVLNNKKG